MAQRTSIRQRTRLKDKESLLEQNAKALVGIEAIACESESKLVCPLRIKKQREQVTDGAREESVSGWGSITGKIHTKGET